MLSMQEALTVDGRVLKDMQDFLKEKIANGKYSLCKATHYRNENDADMYCLIGVNEEKDSCAYWDCYNASVGSLIGGHYDLSQEEAEDLFRHRTSAR